ncbi:dead end protein homolog 1 [Protopterus annectens]|uniref:dead end protein homolog 1 n=1 Tax=Protopterus annectens TaxID=7888 RepID=UPI001CFBA8F6|nr:dead end protein homolog 1 [Protopterus annectens]
MLNHFTFLSNDKFLQYSVLFAFYTLKNEQSKASLDAWVKKTGVKLVQVNGQRKYGGPPTGWIGHPPPCGSEVFIGKIPQDMYEDKLIPLFQSVGQLYEFRLMMTFSGGNRGFAYAKYMSRRIAKAAITALNNYEVEKDCFIVVCRSIEKCELSVDELPLEKDKEEVLQLMKELTAGVRDVCLYPCPENKLKATAIVKYETHQAAAVAKKALVEAHSHLPISCSDSPIAPNIHSQCIPSPDVCRSDEGEWSGENRDDQKRSS